MPVLRTASVSSPIVRDYDGLRILVTRYIPRGCRRTRFDVWMANLGPSERLLKAFNAKELDWKAFNARYEAELFEAAPLDKYNPRIKNHGQKFTLRLLKKLAQRQPVTLMCQCAEDEPHCHRHLLKYILNSRKI
jgi:uncharacterized protein YeaO (DUF488 family)